MDWDKLEPRLNALLGGTATAEEAIAGLTEDEGQQFLVVLNYALELILERKPQKKAMKLLRSWLTPEQLYTLRTRSFVPVEGSAGGRYRLYPETGYVHRVELHGKTWWAETGYCYHEVESDERKCPDADRTLAQLLTLITDEPGFLAAANARPLGATRWSPAWRRRTREAREGRVCTTAMVEA